MTQAAGKRDFRVEIQARTEAEGDRGQSLNDWSKVETRWSSVEPLRGRKLEQARQVAANATTRFEMKKPRNYQLTEKHRLKVKGVVYGIDALIETGERLTDVEILGHSVT